MARLAPVLAQECLARRSLRLESLVRRAIVALLATLAQPLPPVLPLSERSVHSLVLQPMAPGRQEASLMLHWTVRPQRPLPLQRVSLQQPQRPFWQPLLQPLGQRARGSGRAQLPWAAITQAPAEGAVQRARAGARL